MSKNKEDSCTVVSKHFAELPFSPRNACLKAQESDSEDGEDSANDMQALRSFQIDGSGSDSAQRACAALDFSVHSFPCLIQTRGPREKADVLLFSSTQLLQ